MRNLETQGLWMERNTSYSLLMREMLMNPQRGNWKQLREFESGDSADREAWEMAVQYVRSTRQGWRVAGEGIFIKCEIADGDEDDERDDCNGLHFASDSDFGSGAPAHSESGDFTVHYDDGPLLSVDLPFL